MLNSTNLFHNQGYIDGEWKDADGGSVFSVKDPHSGEEVARVADMGVEETRRAIAAAEKAFQSWSRMPPLQRADILRKWEALMLSNIDDLARILSLEEGKLFSEARGEVAYSANFIRWAAEEASRVHGYTIPAPDRNRRMLTIMQPIGVCAAITPWNFPILTPAKNCFPAIAAGNTVILKPAQDTPLSALAVAALAEQAGLPRGVFNVVPCYDPKEVGKELCTHPAVKRIAFTGSTEVGREVMRLSSGTIKRLCLELGGNAPFIVFDDARLEDAVNDAISLKFINCGQVCINPNRFLIQENIHDAFVRKVVEKIRAFNFGSPFDSDTKVTPLVNEAGLKKVESLVEDALQKGARLLTGGKRPDPEKLFYEPTVLTGMTRSMRIHREEIFGPVIACFSFRTEEEALEMANDTEKGLASYFYSRDLGRVWRVAEGLQTGIIGANSWNPCVPTTPFGGIKESGLDAVGGIVNGLANVCESKTVGLGGITDEPAGTPWDVVPD